MISVGNRDGRKGIEQGFNTSKRDMDETELEEGEACSYQDHDDASIDPDIALSYIDEKLQNVLGHFQKDFEGVVSAENLGAKYGIYGSFLPAYRRSPVWSHSRSPPRVQSHNTPQSPNLLWVEGGNKASLAQTSAPHSLKRGSASTCSTSSYANKPSSQSGLYRLTTKTQCMQSLGDSTPKSEARDQKTLKVRIKVGSDSLSVKKSAAIYSGLGLDGSPSSSFDDSPMEGEGLSHRLPIHPHESPTQILQMMTSFPICGSYLLSPLPDDMIQLIDRPELFKDILTHSSSKTNLEYSVVGLPCYSVKENKTICGKSGVKLFDGNSLQVKGDGENVRTDFDLSVKETDIDAASCEELVSNALKLPLLSDTYSTMVETVKDSLTEKACDVAKREPSESFSIPVSLTDRSNGKVYPTGNVVDNRLLDIPDERISDPRKVRDGKGEATSSTNTDTVGLKLKETSKGGFKDPGKQKANKTLSSGNKQLFSVDKKKSKKSQVRSSANKNAAMDGAHDHARVLKNKDSDVEAHTCKSELKSSPFQRELNKASDKYSKTNDTYKDFFGDINELEADIVDSPDMPSGDRLKTSELVEKATLANEIAFAERTSTLEAHKGVISGTDLKRSSHAASLSERGRPISDPAPAGADSEDNWVCCDKCQAWRLLPPGSKVDSLPEKWDCSMLTWLPGLNRCGISDEETTKAVRAQYQLLAENANSIHVPPDRPATGVITADKFDPAMLNDEKMIDKFRKMSKLSFQGSPHRPPSSSKKKQQSAKERSSAEVKESPVINRPDFLQQSKSSDTYGEINKQKKMDKHRGHCDSGGGHAKISKKRERDEEFPKASKTSKKQIILSEDNEGAIAEYQGNDMMTVNSGFGLATNSALKDKMTNSEFFSPRKSKDDMDGDSLDTSDKSKIHVGGFPDVASLHVKKCDSGTLAPKKRKMDNFQDPASFTPSSGKLVLDHDEQRRKKHRISKSGGKESSTSKRNGKAEKRSKSLSQRRNDTEPLRKDSSCAPPAVAATSSSSKVSGSLKAKSKFQELKGSPVESVSSSPFRISNSYKLTSGRKIMVEKGSVKDVKLATGSSVKCADDDYQGGGSQSGFIRKGDSLDPGEQTSDRCVNEATGDDGDHNINVSHSEKFWKESSLLCKDKNTTSSSDKGKVKMSEYYDNLCDNGPVYAEKKREGKIKVPEKSESNVDEIEKDFLSNEQEPSDLKSKTQQDYGQKRSSKKFDVGKSEQLASISSREMSNLPASDRQKNEKSDSLRSKQGNGLNACSSAARVNDLPKESKSDTKVDTQNGTCHIPSKQPISNGHRIKNQDAPSPLRRDAASQAAGNAIKEAKNLKHLADRLKQAAGSTESTGYYFEAALKFLHGASLLESGKTENTKHGDMLQSIKIYSDTAKLCEFCAHEYEKCKDMATAALAYKCMEVAYLRVIYSSHHSASRDRHELQTVLQMVPPGESPSSSASDIDNLNNSATMDKDLQGRNGGSPQLATNLVIAAKNRPTFKRLLSFAQDVNFAMEASRKSCMAFAAANVKMEQEDSKDVIASLKRALDFNFHDVQGLLRLVRLAKEATSH